MMYIHFCNSCGAIYILNGHKQDCPKCGSTISELKLSFEDYSNMLPLDREYLRRRLHDPQFLKSQVTHYRFAKHTKRYQESQIK